MTSKLLPAFAIAVLLWQGANSQEVQFGAAPALPARTVATVVVPQLTENRFSPIESILNNKEVKKEALSRHDIKATGKKGDKTYFIIHFNKKNLHGSWQSFYANGQRRDSGTLVSNLPDGEWKTWYPNGQVESIRHYNALKYQYIQNDLKRNHPKDQKYALTRLATNKGSAVYFMPQYASTTPSDDALSLLHVIENNTAIENSPYLPPFKQALHHGLFMNYFPNGAVKDAGHYNNGLKQGLWRETTADSSTYDVGYYHNGLKKGQWKTYNAQHKWLQSTQYNKKGVATDGPAFTK